MVNVHQKAIANSHRHRLANRSRNKIRYLWSMDNLKALITSEDTWTFAEGIENDLPFFIRYREGLYAFRDAEKHQEWVTIRWNYPLSDEFLLPSEAAQDVMDAFEEKLNSVLEEDMHAVLAFVVTGQLQRVWNWYSSNSEETLKRLEACMLEQEKEFVDINTYPDPSWGEYAFVLGEGTSDPEEDAF